MTQAITLNSPAKVNLFLRVLQRRNDGYHELASLFQAIDLCDKVHLRPAASDRLTILNAHLAADRSNLVWKAIDLFRTKTACRFAVECVLDKQIPLQAGLGGGSSNAATVLWGMNILAGSPLSEEDLKQMGSQIGSDVPFFFSSGLAYCQGRGEEVQSLLHQPTLVDVCVFKPYGGLSTPQVYGALQLSALEKRHPRASLSAFLAGQPIYFNDLEQAAFSLMPQLLAFKLKLQALGFKHVLLAGSGSSLIGIGPLPTHSIAALPGFIGKAKGLCRTAQSWY